MHTAASTRLVRTFTATDSVRMCTLKIPSLFTEKNAAIKLLCALFGPLHSRFVLDTLRGDVLESGGSTPAVRELSLVELCRLTTATSLPPMVLSSISDVLWKHAVYDPSFAVRQRSITAGVTVTGAKS